MPTAISGAIPHAAKAEDEIEGYKIPAGATVVLAVWAANNDPSLFPEPRRFDPSRHNPDRTSFEAATTSDFHDRDHWTFGAGRRICPGKKFQSLLPSRLRGSSRLRSCLQRLVGMHVAERTLFVSMARILWAFNVEPAKDQNGVDIPVDQDEVTQSIAARPLPFQ